MAKEDMGLDIPLLQRQIWAALSDGVCGGPVKVCRSRVVGRKGGGTFFLGGGLRAAVSD